MHVLPHYLLDDHNFNLYTGTLKSFRALKVLIIRMDKWQLILLQ